jgi:hypothetical protein
MLNRPCASHDAHEELQRIQAEFSHAQGLAQELQERVTSLEEDIYTADAVGK